MGVELPSSDAVAIAGALWASAAAGVCIVDRELRYVHVNETLARMNGRPAAAHLGRTVHEVIPPQAADLLAPLLRRVMETGEPVIDAPATIDDRSGVRRHFLSSYHAVRDSDGAVTAVCAMVVEHVGGGEEARVAAERLRAVTDSGIVGVFLWTVDGAVTEANDAFLELCGWTRDDLTAGRLDWRVMTPPEYRESDEHHVRLLLTTGRHAPYPKEYLRKDGSRVPVVVTSAFLPGSREGGVCVCIDDTARRAAEREREHARAEAEQALAIAEAASRAKSHFLATMSHELRTPLNAIGGYAELMEMGLRGPVTAQQRDDLSRIQRSQQHLLGLINEVLNYERLESGSVRYDLEEVGVAGAFAAVESLVLPQARAKGLALRFEPCPPTLAVRADADKLRQILLNLLSNAIKFTDAGGEIVVACHRRTDWTPEVIELSVADTGIGIAPEQLEAIFEPFVQVGRALNRPGEGTGLGLAISRDLARGMHGDLTVTSVPGRGSTFTLVLPRTA